MNYDLRLEEVTFRNRVDKALDELKLVLDNTKHPQYASEVPHAYEDKYVLAERVVNGGLSACGDVLKSLGVTPEHFKTIKAWAKERSVSIRFFAEQTCEFMKEEMRELDDKQTTVHTKSSFGSFSGTSETTIKNKVKEFYWKFTSTYSLTAFKGDVVEDDIVIRDLHTAVTQVITRSSNQPQCVPKAEFTCNITYLVQHVGEDGVGDFGIDRMAETCRTPCRNKDVEQLLSQFQEIRTWCYKTGQFFNGAIFCWHDHTKKAKDLTWLNETLFVPAIPIMDASGEDGAHLSPSDLLAIMSLHKKRVAERMANCEKYHPDDGSLITWRETQLCGMFLHLSYIHEIVHQSLAYIENLLWKQVVAAVGKAVTISDMTSYMAWHNARLFPAQYKPVPFCYDVRRNGGYAPEGFLSIDMEVDSAKDPIVTCVRMIPKDVATEMKFALSASNMVSFRGDHYLHGFMANRFSTETPPTIQMTARARQFSSFILLVGRIASSTLFDPKYAIILKDKDEVLIPLLMNPLPTAGEFRDAISSLSPEQQRFAKAFRAMQLESTLFGVCVVQIKPQLEKLLNLPNGGLTKEIMLNQQLMDLFIDYQVPSDLMTYSGPQDATLQQKLDAVKGHVKNLFEMINKTKNEELAVKKQETLFDRGGVDYRTESGVHDVSVRSRRSMAFGAASFAAPPAPPPPAGAFSGGAPPLLMGMAAPMMMQAVPVQARVQVQQQMTKNANVEVVQTMLVEEEKPAPAQQESNDGGMGGVGVTVSTGLDYTKIPAALDAQFLKLDQDSQLRPTTITVGKKWEKMSYSSLLSPHPDTKTLCEDDLKKETARAMDLLDALSRSGDLTLEDATMHVIVAATHCFDHSLMDSLVQQNINPIEHMERSTLMIASTIHDQPVKNLLAPAHVERVKQISPSLFLANSPHETCA